MTEALVGPAALWFEDFEPGQVFVTHGRTLQESDGAMWAMFTGDWHPLHVDDHAAASGSAFDGRRFPPGLMGIAIASGLWERLGILHGSALYIAEVTFKYRRPMTFGDTIRFRATVKETTPSHGKRPGIVRFRQAIISIDDAVFAEGDLVVAVAPRPDEVVASYGLVSGPKADTAADTERATE